MIDKSKTCVIISSYLPSYKEIAFTSLTIEGYKALGFDVCITSHTAIPTELQKACKYSVYSDENELLKYTRPVTFSRFFTYDNFRYNTTNGNGAGSYSFAILLNLWNAIEILKNKGYTHFLLADNDALFDKVDGALLLEHMEESNFYDLDFFGYKESEQLIVSSFFGGKISTWLDIMNKINTGEKYLEFIEESGHGSYNPTFEGFINNLIQTKHLVNHKVYAHPLRVYFKNEWQGRQGGGFCCLPLFDQSYLIAEITKGGIGDNRDNFYLVLENVAGAGKTYRVQTYQDDNLVLDFDYIEGSTISYYGLGNEGENWEIKILDDQNKVVFSKKQTREEVLWDSNCYLQIYK